METTSGAVARTGSSTEARWDVHGQFIGDSIPDNKHRDVELDTWAAAEVEKIWSEITIDDGITDGPEIAETPEETHESHTHQQQRRAQGWGGRLLTMLGHPSETEANHEHLHDHSHCHSHEHSDERSAQPRVWRRVAGFLLGVSSVELTLEAATEAQPRAAVGLDVFHTLLADVPDYLARGEARILPVAALAVGAAFLGNKAKGVFGKVQEKLSNVRDKITAGAMTIGNTAALAYTGLLIKDNPDEYNPLTLPGHDLKSYAAPAVGLAGVKLAGRYARTRLKDSASHVDRDGIEHLVELDGGDAEGRLLLGAMINPFAGALATTWYAIRGNKFAARLWKGEHGHGEHSEVRAVRWRRARLALGAAALAGSLGGQLLADSGEDPGFNPSANEWEDEKPSSNRVEPPPTSVQVEPIVVELPVYNATTSPHEGTYWSLAYQQATLLLGRTPTDIEVHSLTSRLLSQNNETWETATGARPGDEVEMLDPQTASTVLALAT